MDKLNGTLYSAVYSLLLPHTLERQVVEVEERRRIQTNRCLLQFCTRRIVLFTLRANDDVDALTTRRLPLIECVQLCLLYCRRRKECIVLWVDGGSEAEAAIRSGV